MIEALRTPDERFRNLPDFPFAPHYLDRLAGYEGLRLHYLDEGPKAARRTFFCLHGQPTWAYLYRKMIPVLAAAGYRAIVPDLFGFGRSDKPAAESVYTFGFHRTALIRVIERLDLHDIVLVCQDWGGLLGLTIPMDMADRFHGLLVMNTALGTGDVPLSKGFLAWRDFSNRNPDMDVAKLLQRACPHLRESEAAAYGAPFPDARYKAGVRRFPNLVPDKPEADGAALSRRAREWWRDRWTGKSLMAIGMQDPVLGPPVMRALHKLIRNCPEPMEIGEAGHFVQEWGVDIAQAAVRQLV